MAWQDTPLGQMSRRAVAAVVAGGRLAWAVTLPLARVLWSATRLIVRRTVEILLALILLFEEWGWRPLAALLARLARIPWIGRLESVIADLPPYGALAAFVTPSLLILPLKLVALYLITGGHAISAALLFIGAKIAGTAILARLFMLTQPKLMQIGWFARTYNWLMPWKDRTFAAIRASWAWRYGRVVKYRLAQGLKARWSVWRPTVLAWRQWALERGREALARLRALVSR